MSSFYFQIAENILRQGGFGALSPEQMKQYTPTLAALIEERVGIELLPKLNEAQAKQIVDLTEKGNTTEEEWRKFWTAAAPNFESEMARIVGEFAGAAQSAVKK